MTQQHPITPPPELVEQWAHLPADWNTVAFLIAQWGADAELEACCEWLQDPDLNVDTYKLRAARRPKPQSLKEQALEALDEEQAELSIQNYKLIRSVLEQLPDNN